MRAAAGDHRADAAGAAVVHGRLHLPLQAEDSGSTRRALKAQLDAGRLPARQPGRVARASTRCAAA
ncbi:MAG: hypothetical protein MZW92_70150 [Comamonadaceae bacterium]|nr:hypothetical protein [Comamonadaceae bacterium]